METLNRLVTESLARHGFDRPVDYRRLQWSHWFRCESPHSLLLVPSKPGVFALAEEITHVATAASAVPQTLSEVKGSGPIPNAESRKPEADSARRMLGVTQFFEADDMAFVLDRMLSRENPMRARLTSGRYFIRYVVIEDQSQRHSICGALNQWIASAAEKATGIGPHFASSMELTPVTDQASVGRTLLSATADTTSLRMSSNDQAHTTSTAKTTQLEVIAAKSVHAFPSGF